MRHWYVILKLSKHPIKHEEFYRERNCVISYCNNNNICSIGICCCHNAEKIYRYSETKERSAIKGIGVHEQACYRRVPETRTIVRAE